MSSIEETRARVARRGVIYGIERVGQLLAEIARLRTELAEARDMLARAAEVRNEEIRRSSYLASETVRLEAERDEARRERDELSDKLDAMTNQAVMLSGRRATIVDASERDAILSEIAHALDIPDASLPSILGAIAGSDTVISQLQAEVKRLREAMQLGQESPRPPIDFDEPDDAARGGSDE